MTSCVRVLSTQELDSFPSILLVAPNGKKILVNCGEGCQRVFLEFGQKVSTIDMVCLTHLGHESIGGLPGMILTASDVVKQATDHAKHALMSAALALPQNQKPKQSNKKGKNKGNQKKNLLSQPVPQGLKILGPVGTGKFFQSLRHFMRRDSFSVNIREGSSYDGAQTSSGQSHDRSHTINRDIGKKTKNRGPNTDDGSFAVQSFSAYARTSIIATDAVELSSKLNSESEFLPSKKRPRTNLGGENYITDTANITAMPEDDTRRSDSREILSFLFTTPPIKGRFLIEKARALGVPRGPLYGQLKAGKTITFESSDCNGESTTVTVKSDQVVEPGSPGVVVAVLCYPCDDVLDQLKNSKQVKQFELRRKETQTAVADTSDNKINEAKRPTLELIVHITTQRIFESNSCVTWRQSFQKSVRHMFVRAKATTSSYFNEIDTRSLSAFQSAHSGARLRSKIYPDVFRAPLSEIGDYLEKAMDEAHQDQSVLRDDECEAKIDELSDVVNAVPLLEYVLLPRAKRGFSNNDLFLKRLKALEEEAQALLDRSGCLDRAKVILEECSSSSLFSASSLFSVDAFENRNASRGGEILFTGTGSAVPCKHRNVSGIYVRMENGNAILLDVGEGTIGQLLRAKQLQENREGESLADVLKNIKAVWISHPHADHHLGIIRLLEERKGLVADHDPLVLIAPSNILRFLQEYESVEPRVAKSYVFVDCNTLNVYNNDVKNSDASATHVALRRLQQELGINVCKAIPVAHCAQSFAVVFHGTSFGSLAYSGDCRPSKNFAEVAYNADLLIHEATFADGMEADAVVKRHCTVGEALQVAKNMNAKTTILTHFSQRYPKIPMIRTSQNTENNCASNTTLSKMRVIHAFDFMTITPSNIPAASKLTPALRMLYPEDPEDAVEMVSEGKSVAQIASEVPGLFARSELL